MTAGARTMPHSPEAEVSVIGGILLSPKALRLAAAHVEAQDFYHPAHAAIFGAAVEVSDAGHPVDVLTVGERMRASGAVDKLRGVGGEAYFAELTTQVVTVDNIAHHAKMIAGKAMRRRLIEAAQEIAAHGYRDDDDPGEFAGRAVRSLQEAARSRSTAGLVSQAESIQTALEEFEAARTAAQTGARGPTITTGFANLDDALAGGWRREYVVLAARPSMGKTSLAMDAVESAAQWGDAAVLVLSLEMTHTALSLRRLSTAANVNGHLLRSGRVTDEEVQAIGYASTHLRPLPIWYGATKRISDVVALARAWAIDERTGASRPRRLIVCDYIQLVEMDADRKGWSRSRVDEITDASAALKGLVTDCDATVIALSQLNRELEGRDDKRPRKSDLRGSGAIEEHADVLVMLYRDEVYNPASPWRGVAEAIIEKARNGPLSTQYLGWNEATTHFYQLPPSWMPPDDRPPAHKGRGNRHAKGGEDS